MHDRKTRLAWTVLAIALPGPWTPVIVLAYLLGRTAGNDQHPRHRPPPCPQPDPYACFPAPVSPTWNPYAPPQPVRSR